MAVRTDIWFTSSRSADNQQCVEVRFGGVVGVRDSKDRGGPALGVDRNAWRAFVEGVKSGRYDD